MYKLCMGSFATQPCELILRKPHPILVCLINSGTCLRYHQTLNIHIFTLGPLDLSMKEIEQIFI